MEMIDLQAPEISVIVPVYETERFLSICIDSILAQTFRNFELILVDDGSSDNCPQICDRYAEADARVRVIHQKNQGIATARNNALKVSTGKWIVFVDSDDVISPYCLEYLYHAALKFNVKMAVSRAVECNEHPKHFPEMPDPKFTVFSLSDNVLLKCHTHNQYFTKTVWAKLIARETVLSCLFDDGRIYEDNAVVPKWLASVSVVAYSDIPLYFYYINPAGTVRKKYTIKQTDNVWAKRVRFFFYKNMNYPQMMQYAFEEYIIVAAVAYSRCIKELHDTSAACTIKKEFLKVYFPNMKLDHLSATKKFSVFECFHPALANIYYLWKVLKRKISGIFSAKN